MKALIIGGNRFFGKRLAASLAQRGDEVTLLNRGNLDDGLGSRVKRIRCDRAKLSRDTPALEHYDVIYDQVCYETHEAERIVEVFAGRCGKLIFTSSQSVYDPGQAIREDAFKPEGYPARPPADRNQNYKEAKRQCEAAFFAQKNFPVTAVRFPIVLGPDDYTGRLAFHVDRIRDGRKVHLPNPDARISFIHAEDAARALEWLAFEKLTGPVNCSAPEPIRLKDLIMRIETATGKKAALDPSGEESPFGIRRDWFMSTKRLNSAGFEARPIAEWIDELLR